MRGSGRSLILSCGMRLGCAAGWYLGLQPHHGPAKRDAPSRRAPAGRAACRVAALARPVARPHGRRAPLASPRAYAGPAPSPCPAFPAHQSGLRPKLQRLCEWLPSSASSPTHALRTTRCWAWRWKAESIRNQRLTACSRSLPARCPASWPGPNYNPRRPN